MTDLLEPQAGDTACSRSERGVGYQAAILSKLVKQVYSIDIIEELALDTRRRLERLGYRNIEIGVGNGYCGWSEHAPYDKIIVTAAPDLIPAPPHRAAQAGRQDGGPDRNPRQAAADGPEKSVDGKLATREVLPVRFSELEEGGEAGGAA